MSPVTASDLLAVSPAPGIGLQVPRAVQEALGCTPATGSWEHWAPPRGCWVLGKHPSTAHPTSPAGYQGLETALGTGHRIPVSQCSLCKIPACLSVSKPFPGLLLSPPAAGCWAGKGAQTPGWPCPRPHPHPQPSSGTAVPSRDAPGPCEWQWHAAVSPCPRGQGGCWHRGRGCPGRSCSGRERGRESLGCGGCSPW